MWMCPNCKTKNDTKVLLCAACGVTRFNKLTRAEQKKFEVEKANRYLRSKGVDPDAPCWKPSVIIHMNKVKQNPASDNKLKMPEDLK